MIRFEENFNLKPYNTFQIEAFADYFFEFTESEDLKIFLQNNRLPQKYFIMGGGSNLLFLNDFKGLIFYPNILGKYLVYEDATHAYVEAGAGEDWDQFVDYAVENEWGGLENLSLIPGKVGASPVQNIGAYGEEACNRIELVRALEIETGEYIEFTNDQCKFGYRDSIFKNELAGKVLVTSVLFKLDKIHSLNLKYGALKDEAEKLGELSIKTLRQAIVQIRQSKLPDPLITGNAGSFFMNPVVPASLANDLLQSYPKMPIYQTNDDAKVKLAAGWLIEQAGWKGFRDGDAGVHADQALVLVNHGNATGVQIMELARKIQNSVHDLFGVELRPEVNVLA